MTTRLVSTVAGVALLVTACQGVVFGERGSGDLVTEDREVAGFTQVVLESQGTVSIEVTGTESLTIEAEDNLMPILTSEVSDGRLVLGASRQIRPTRTVKWTITVATLDGIEISGSGAVQASDVTSDGFDIDISGSGDVHLTGLSLGNLTTRIAGSGSISLAGAARHLDLSIPGSGNFDGRELTTATGVVSISGSGDAVVTVTDALEASVSGSGSVEYLGDPTVSSSITGSGSVRPGG